jgi:acetolactate synthase-1/2/3 large subunit
MPPPAADGAGHIDAIHFVRELSNHLSEDAVILLDTGGNLTWCSNNLRVKGGQKVFSAWNFTPMGYALPASLGAHAAEPGRPLTCITGDGGLQLCLGELATIVRYNIPVKIILFNNHSHGIQKQTLETWLDGRYVGVDPGSGLGFVDFPRVAAAHGLPLVTIDRTSDVREKLKQVYATPGPVFCNVEITPSQKLYPVVKFGQPLENQMPLMPAGDLQSLKTYVP